MADTPELPELGELVDELDQARKFWDTISDDGVRELFILERAECDKRTQQLREAHATIAALRKERDDAPQRAVFAGTDTPLPCGCPTFYLYVNTQAGGKVFCGQCGAHYATAAKSEEGDRG